MNYLRKTMDKSVSEQNKLLDNLEKSISSTFKEKAEKKAKEMESSANKYFALIFDKMDIVQTMLKGDKKEEEVTA
jgi:BMFP domain-containing protein YqiC